MAEPEKPPGATGASGTPGASEAPKPKAVPAPASQGNPAFRMLGLPRIRAKLPSRNWSIFWGVVISFSSAVIYDRREKRRIQQKWCDAVSHLSRETLEPSTLPRKLTVFLAAPPGDGLRPSREYFQEYVRPILVAAAIDWDVVEGRKEGDVRARLAERIRTERRRNGEGEGPLEEDADIVKDIRARNNILAGDDRGGDLVIGRHTWKEYMRGLHEGYLGPVRDPTENIDSKPEDATSIPQPNTPTSTSDPTSDNPVADLESITGPSAASDDARYAHDTSPIAGTLNDAENMKKDFEKRAAEMKAAEKPADEKPKKISPPPALLPTTAYPTAPLASSSPSTFAPAIFLDQPHVLGFLNTPQRTARFLNRRALAEKTGAEVALLILASGTRPFAGPGDGGSLTSDFSSFPNTNQDLSSDQDASAELSQRWEQAAIGAHAERDWHKSARAERPEGVEAVWMDHVVVDARIGQRMRVPVQDSTAASSLLGEAVMTDAGAKPEKLAQGRSREWTGGVDTTPPRSWGEWFVYVTGFEDEKKWKPRGKGAKDGLVGGDD